MEAGKVERTVGFLMAGEAGSGQFKGNQRDNQPGTKNERFEFNDAHVDGDRHGDEGKDHNHDRQPMSQTGLFGCRNISADRIRIFGFSV